MGTMLFFCLFTYLDEVYEALRMMSQLSYKEADNCSNRSYAATAAVRLYYAQRVGSSS